MNSKYLPIQDKILFWDGRNIGLRGDYNGVLLLDTILQTPVVHTDDIVKVELLLNEAVLLLYSLNDLKATGLENTTDAINELIAKITIAQACKKKGIKAKKVNLQFISSSARARLYLREFFSLYHVFEQFKLLFVERIIAKHINVPFSLELCATFLT